MPMHRLVLAVLTITGASALRAQTVEQATSGTDALLQAVSPVSEAVVWVSGHRGTVLRSTDGGATWLRRPVDGAEALQFRDIHAASADIAWILSAGPGVQSQIYHTRDGGTTWVRQFLNTDSTAFYDCLTFFDERTGVAYSDASQGRTNILRTTDGGRHWELLPVGAAPTPLEGEGAFAASGGCVTSYGRHDGWIALGGPGARLFRTRDAGLTWSLHQTPLVRGPSAGNTAITFRDASVGLVVGGDIGSYATDTSAAAVAYTSDGGDTWELRPRPPRPGAPFGASWVPGLEDPVAVVAGPGGLFATDDTGRTWRTLDERSFWSVAATGRRAWAVGPGGTILVLTF
jgi:photosystem II stability/assembly factor-like uncharacterized protein